MQKLSRPIVLNIGGYDPSGGAGLLADIKTCEQHKVYGLGIVTALTFQTESDFFSVNWISEMEVASQIKTYLKYYDVKVVKVGIIENWEVLNTILETIKFCDEKVKIIVDPVLKSSSGFDFVSNVRKDLLISVLNKTDLLTPNYDEIKNLGNNRNAIAGAKELAIYCNIFLKGGHNPKEPGTDYLFQRNSQISFASSTSKVSAKHGSGCVLAVAIAANLASGRELPEACKKAKQYTEKFLNSNKSLLGYHVQ
jgi:hydroxymethylpyrimidine/phosphomethylpyrimidine kinase